MVTGPAAIQSGQSQDLRGIPRVGVQRPFAEHHTLRTLPHFLTIWQTLRQHLTVLGAKVLLSKPFLFPWWPTVPSPKAGFLLLSLVLSPSTLLPSVLLTSCLKNSC